MPNTKTYALLDENDVIINTIVIDDSTPPGFLDSLVSDNHIHAEVKATEKIDQLKNQPAIGWKRTSPGKYDSPPVIEPEPETDVVSEVLADERLGVLDSAQKAVLEDVLADHIS